VLSSIDFSPRSMALSVPLKSYRVLTSRVAWSTALRTSCSSISDTTSNVGMAPPEDREKRGCYSTSPPGSVPEWPKGAVCKTAAQATLVRIQPGPLPASEVPLEPNAQMVEYWNGPEGVHWIDHEARFDRMLAPFVEPILDVAAVGAGDHVIDIGCGNGALSRAAATRAARGTGLDVSEPMIHNARLRAAEHGLGKADLLVGDAQVR